MVKVGNFSHMFLEDVTGGVRACHKQQIQNAHIGIEWRVKLWILRVIVFHIFKRDAG